MKKNTGKYEALLRWLLLAGYIALNLILVLKHEPWRDEALHWLIPRELSLGEVFAQMKYQGHPCLWNLIQMPFAKAGFPYQTVDFISLALMSLAAWLLLFKSPFPLWVKGLLIFSPSFTYFLPVIARSYCLIPLFVLLLAQFYEQRNNRPLLYGVCIALLLQTHIIMAGMAGILWLCWISEKGGEKERAGKVSSIFGWLIPVISAVLLFLQLFGAEKSSFFSPQEGGLTVLLRAFLLKLIEAFQALFGSNLMILCVLLMLCCVMLGFTARKVPAFRKPLLILLVSVFFQLCVYVIIYDFSTQRLLSWAFILIFSLWISWKELPKENLRSAWNLVLSGMAILMLIHFFPEIRADYAGKYSDSKRAAEFIQEEIPENALIVTNSDAVASALVPYLDEQRIWYPITRKWVSYICWNQERFTMISYDEMVERIRLAFPEQDSFYLIYNDPEGYVFGLQAVVDAMTPLYQTKGDVVTNDTYKIYEFPQEGTR